MYGCGHWTTDRYLCHPPSAAGVRLFINGHHDPSRGLHTRRLSAQEVAFAALQAAASATKPLHTPASRSPWTTHFHAPSFREVASPQALRSLLASHEVVLLGLFPPRLPSPPRADVYVAFKRTCQAQLARSPSLVCGVTDAPEVLQVRSLAHVSTGRVLY